MKLVVPIYKRGFPRAEWNRIQREWHAANCTYEMASHTLFWGVPCGPTLSMVERPDIVGLKQLLAAGLASPRIMVDVGQPPWWARPVTQDARSCEQCDATREREGRRTGEPCDICDGRGYDFLDRDCRHCRP